MWKTKNVTAGIRVDTLEAEFDQWCFKSSTIHCKLTFWYEMPALTINTIKSNYRPLPWYFFVFTMISLQKNVRLRREESVWGCVWSVACRCLEWMGWTLVCTWRIRLVHETPWAGDIIACTSYTAALVANTSRCSDARSAPAERTETNMVTTHTHTHTRMSHSSSKHTWERPTTHIHTQTHRHTHTQETGKVEDKDSATADKVIYRQREREKDVNEFCFLVGFCWNSQKNISLLEKKVQYGSI